MGTVEPKPHESAILMSAPMVIAALAGSKTVTRRIVNLKTLRVRLNKTIGSDEPLVGLGASKTVAKPGTYHAGLNPQGAVFALLDDGERFGLKPGEFHFVCPYAIGDTTLVRYGTDTRTHWTIMPRSSRLWVKETWSSAKSMDKLSPHKIGEACINAGYRTPWAPIRYVADGNTNNVNIHSFASDDVWGRKRVSIHMPRWACRLALRVTNVRLERLHDITEEDAQREGVTPVVTYRDGFQKIWRTINGDTSWDENPWTWRVEFERDYGRYSE